jgi:hypothetical protein
MLSDPVLASMVIFAIIFRLLNETRLTIKSALLTVAGAVFVTIAITPAIVEYFAVTSEALQLAIAALAALTGELVLRIIIAITQDPSKGIELWNEFRGQKHD